MNISTTTIKDKNGFMEIREQWESLCHEDLRSTMFQEYNWMHIWWLTYAKVDDELNIVCAHHNDVLVAIFPLYIKHENKTLMFIGTGEDESAEVATEYLDIICLTEFEEVAVESFVEALRKNKLFGAKKMLIKNLLSDSRIREVTNKLSTNYWFKESMVGARYQNKLADSHEQFLEALSPSFKKKMQRLQRKFENVLAGQIKLASDTVSKDKLFDQLVSLHQKRWLQKNESGAFNDQRFVSFHQQYMNNMLKSDNLMLAALDIQGDAVAVIYIINYKNTLYFYQSGIDDSFKPNISPGYLIHFIMMKIAIEEGKHAYDFMKGSVGSSYKRQLSNTETYMYERILLKKSLGNILQMIKWRLANIRDVVNDAFISSKRQ